MGAPAAGNGGSGGQNRVPIQNEVWKLPRVLEVVALGEVPVEVEPEEAGGDAPAVGGDGVLEPPLVAVVETERLELVVPGAADVEEEHAADALEGEDRRREHVDQREAVLDVGEEGAVADERAEVDAAQGVQAAEVERARPVAAGCAGEDAERQVAAPRHRDVLPDVEVDGGESACRSPSGRERRRRRGASGGRRSARSWRRRRSRPPGRPARSGSRPRT